MDELSEGLQQTQARLAEQFGERVTFTPPFRGQLAAIVQPADIVEVCGFARDDDALGYRLLSDITAVDHLDELRVPRFDVVYHLVSFQHKAWLRIKVPVEPGESVPSVTGLWRGANFMEREVYDMFGIPFQGHPNLSRIIMPDDYTGHPLRRDFDIGDVPIDFDIPHRKRFGHA